jgi:hypothetical protein
VSVEEAADATGKETASPLIGVLKKYHTLSENYLYCHAKK